MVKSVFCIWDKICVMWRTPMFAPNAAVMVRDLGDEVRRGGEGNSLSTHPKDYCLHQVGEWDDETGLMDWYSPSKFVVEISALVDPTVDESGHEHGGRVQDPGHAHQSALPLGSGSTARVPLVKPNPQVGMP